MYVRSVEAGGTGRTSTSNMICMNMVVPNFPQNQYLNYVTVRSGTKVEVSCYIDLDAEVQYYNIERSVDTLDGYDIVSQIIPSTDSLLVFVDSTVSTSNQVYFYRVTAVDICGNTIVYSNVSNTILLELVHGTDEYVNEIVWNEYNDWETFGGGVSCYNIYRSNGSNFSEPPIAIVPPGQDYYIDDISDDANDGGTFCYMVKAVESEGNIYSFVDSSHSNVVCTQVTPKIYIPNAFTPNNNT